MRSMLITDEAKGSARKPLSLSENTPDPFVCPPGVNRHRCPISHLRGGLIVPPFEVSVKPGPAQNGSPLRRLDSALWPISVDRRGEEGDVTQGFC